MKFSTEEKNNLFENIIEQNWDAIVFANMEGIVEFVNSAANNLYGYSGDELIGQNVDIFNSHLTHNTADIVEALINNGQWYGELIQRKKDDSTFEALLHVQIIKDRNGVPIGYASNSKDITNDKITAKKLKQTIEEKEMLIKEIHHRVKNNLSTVQGMLNLQFRSINDPTTQNLLREFQTRLKVLAEAHNNLSSDRSIQEINLGKYIEKIALDIHKLFENPQNDVRLNISIEPTVVSIDNAIPCGLIVNEIVTNAFKHAFESGGELNLAMKTREDIIEITIEDNGPGFDLAKELSGDSLGLSLIDGLVNQIEGESAFEFKNGTDFKLRFKSI